MIVPVINKSNNPLPTYANPGDAGFDYRADLTNVNEKFLFNAHAIKHKDNTIDHLVICPGGRALVPTEIYTAIPVGYEIQVRPRSGLALKSGITVLNSPGTIDSGFRNGHGVILMNCGTENFLIYQGDRIAQGVLAKVESIEWEEVEDLENSTRGTTGFGASGVK